MTLKDFVEKAEQSDRLLVVDKDRKEIYKGYAANFHKRKEELREVKKVSLYTEIYRRGQSTKRIENVRPLGEKIELEDTEKFKFADLEMRIYTKVILEDCEN